MVEHRIRIADRAVRNRHGPLMGGKKIECKQRGTHHKVVNDETAEVIALVHRISCEEHDVSIVPTDLNIGTDMSLLETARYMKLVNLIKFIEG